MAVAVEGRLDGGVPELRLDHFRVLSLGDQECRVSVAITVSSGVPEIGGVAVAEKDERCVETAGVTLSLSLRAVGILLESFGFD